MVNSFLKTDLWGSLLNDQAVTEAFSTQRVIGHMVQFEIAWTRGLLAAGRVTDAQAEHAIAAMTAFGVDAAELSAGAQRDGLPVPSFVAQIKASVPEDVKAAIHTGSTSQDVLDTSLVLASREIFAVLEPRLAAVSTGLRALDARFGGNPLMGRTRMQAALPITVGQRLKAWSEPIDALHESLGELVAQSSVVQLGGAVSDRAFAEAEGGAVIVDAVADALGLGAAGVWHNNRSRFVDMGHWMVKLTGACAKIGIDVSLMAQQGIDEIRLTGGGGSSAMPHKQNPVRAEILVALGRYVAGQNAILGQALIHEQERSGAAWTLEWLTLPAMFEATGVALATTLTLLEQIEDIGSNL